MDPLQPSLFGDDTPTSPAPPPHPPDRRQRPERGVLVLPAAIDPALEALSRQLPARLRLGTSSWNFPGWAGLVWGDEYEAAMLSRHGLPAYARHPLLRTVSLDRSFYRPLTAAQYADYAAQVPDDFRFVVKAPSLVADALVRDADGRGMQPNTTFLDATLAVEQFARPALDGLGHKLGVLVFQLSPLPARWLQQLPELLARLQRLLDALPALQPAAPDAVVALEVRDAELLAPPFVDVLRAAGATYCLGVHPKLPPIAEQLPLLRALWPGPMVCRWNLNAVNGAYGYEDARARYAPFNDIVDADPATRETLARVIRATTAAGHNAFITINNKAEGSAPQSVAALAAAVASGDGDPAPSALGTAASPGA